MPRRIIPVSSGKGGVGKTTFAINFALALSRSAPTLLVDLDTGTSSVRSTLRSPVGKDLYHFQRKGAKLTECINRLDPALDRSGDFRDFGFIAGPRHFLSELANPEPAFRRRLAAELNTLPAEYVVLDLRAGLDENVLDFLPYTNSGILIFTPHHPTATLAASDIVKAILFRTLRHLFAPGSNVYQLPGLGDSQELINELLDVTEDVYDPAIPNLDHLVRDLRDVFGEQPLLAVLDDVLEEFRVHYVLNMFDGVEESYEQALRPLVQNLSENVSSRLNLTQLGWIVADERVHQANCAGVPILLDTAKPKKREGPAVDPVMAELEALTSAMLGIHRRARPAAGTRPVRQGALDPGSLLDGQLASLRTMFTDRAQDSVKENFSYITYRVLNLISPPRLPTEFGESAIAQPDQILRWFLRRQP